MMTSALDPDSSFSLSAQQYGSNSEFIFVKLTDAAIEAIEQFARNQNNKEFSSKATIQFLENEGFLSIPTNDGDENQSFSFSLAEEEKQEEFELLEESGGAINVLGGIHSRLRVHAREDVYEKTRHNMLEVAQTQKNKCIKEIKTNNRLIPKKRSPRDVTNPIEVRSGSKSHPKSNCSSSQVVEKKVHHSFNAAKRSSKQSQKYREDSRHTKRRPEAQVLVEAENFAEPVAKKQRVSHSRKQTNNDSSSSISISSISVSPNDVGYGGSSSARESIDSWKASVSASPNDGFCLPTRSSLRNSRSPADGSSGSSSRHSLDSSFNLITSVNQRQSYKNEFNKWYGEYRQLHSTLVTVRNHFVNLQTELNAIDPSDQNKSKIIKNKIVKEYHEKFLHDDIQSKHQRFNFLHSKLANIKELIDDFDARLMMN